MPRGRSFDEIRADVAARAALAFPDRVLPLARLKATGTGAIEVPGLGTLGLTDWSRRQLARMLGIRWHRWFDEGLVSPVEQAEEINRRLERHPGEWKVRSRRHAPGEDVAGDGVLRALLSPGYTPIDDARVFDRLIRVLGPRTGEFRFVRTAATDETTQYVAATDEEVDLGVRRPDLHRNGFVLANSEVGARAVSIEVYVWRLVCTNGLVLPDSRLFHRVHRATEDERIDRDLAYALSLLPERWRAGTVAFRAARQETVAEPEEALRQLLAASPEARSRTDAVLAAYREEPEATRFGLVQAITRAAQALAPEARLALEQFAARQLPSFQRKAAS